MSNKKSKSKKSNKGVLVHRKFPPFEKIAEDFGTTLDSIANKYQQKQTADTKIKAEIHTWYGDDSREHQWEINQYGSEKKVLFFIKYRPLEKRILCVYPDNVTNAIIIGRDVDNIDVSLYEHGLKKIVKDELNKFIINCKKKYGVNYNRKIELHLLDPE